MYAKKFLAGFFLRIICLACLPAFVAACSMGGKGAPTPTPVPQVVSKERIIFTVERGSIINQRIIAGEIVPAQQDELFFRTPGYIGNAYVKTGDMVKKGDVLGELQMDDLLDQLEQARIDLEVSQNTLAIEQLQKAYDIQKAESEVVIAQKEVDQAARQVVKTIGAQKEEAQLNLEIAQERLKTAQAWLNLVKGKQYSDTAQIVKRNQLAVDRLERMVSDRQLIAPYDGYVLFISLIPGAQAEAYRRYAQVGDPTQLLVQVSYDYELSTSADANTIAYLQEKDASNSNQLLLQYPLKFIPGFLPLSQRKEGITMQGDNIVVNYLYFSLPADLPRAKTPVGNRVNINVVFGSQADALLLPPAAIRGNEAFKYVIVLEDDYHRRVELVSIGVQGKDRWEIVANLKEGDQILGP